MQYLNDQLIKYKFRVHMIAIGEDKDLSEIRQIHEAGTKSLVEELKKGSNQNNLSAKIRELAKEVGTAGDARQRLLKAAVKLIIENLVPERMRMLFKVCDMGPKCTDEEYEEL